MGRVRGHRRGSGAGRLVRGADASPRRRGRRPRGAGCPPGREEHVRRHSSPDARAGADLPGLLGPGAPAARRQEDRHLHDAGPLPQRRVRDRELRPTPYNGYTVFRPEFDRWLASEAQRAGATLITRTTVDDVIREGGKIAGIRVLRGGGELRAPVVIASDGVLSVTAGKAGLRKGRVHPDHLALGVKALLELPKQVIDDRFGLVRDQGASRGVPGVHRSRSWRRVPLHELRLDLGGARPPSRQPPRERWDAYDLLNAFVEHPQVAKVLRGARLLEYSAHLIPEGGYEMMPQLVGDGIVVAGDAAGFCCQGPEPRGHQPGRALGHPGGRGGDRGARGERPLGAHARRLPAPARGELRPPGSEELPPRSQAARDRPAVRGLPELICDFMDRMYRIDGKPKDGLVDMGLGMARKRVGAWSLLRDAWTTWRSIWQRASRRTGVREGRSG